MLLFLVIISLKYWCSPKAQIHLKNILNGSFKEMVSLTQNLGSKEKGGFCTSSPGHIFSWFKQPRCNPT